MIDDMVCRLRFELQVTSAATQRRNGQWKVEGAGECWVNPRRMGEWAS